MANTEAAPAAPAPSDPNHERRWWILGVLAVGQLMVILDATVVNIALPSAQKALHFSNGDRQWIITAYALAFGSLLLLGGRLSDLVGRKTTLVVGLIGFAVASAVGGAATSFAMLAAARAVQGAFGALLAPAILSLLSTTFADPRERGKAFAIYGAVASGGGAVGLLLGGVLTSYLSWRWCLYVNLVFALAATVGALVFLAGRDASAKPKLDLPGTVVVCAGLFSIVYGTSHAETSHWSNPVTIGFLVAGAVLLAAFAWIQTRVSSPLLPPRVILDRNRAGAYLAVFVASAGVFGVFLFITYYLQGTLGYSPVRTGVAYLPMVAGIATMSILANTKLLPRFGPRPLVAGGMTLGGCGMLIFTQLGLTSSYVTHVLPGLVATGMGMGLIIAPSMQTATSRVNPTDAGVASAMVNTSQQIGGSIGTALLNTLAASAATAYVTSHRHGALPSAHVMAAATVHSYTTAFWVAVGIFAFGLVATTSLLRWRPSAAPLDEEGLIVDTTFVG